MSQYDPGRDAAERYPEWDIVRRPLDGAYGVTFPARRLIVVDATATRAEQQVTLAHELVHLDQGDCCAAGDAVLDVKRERAVHEEAARRLIPFRRLVQVLQVDQDEHMHSYELGVDLATLRLRCDLLTDDEKAHLQELVRARDEGAA